MSGSVAEFLLARIAEDEAVVRANPTYFIEWDGALRDAPRPMAECKAKRAIVELHEDCDSSSCGWPCETLLALATVYADDPAYEAWWAPTAPEQTPDSTYQT